MALWRAVHPRTVILIPDLGEGSPAMRAILNALSRLFGEKRGSLATLQIRKDRFRTEEPRGDIQY